MMTPSVESKMQLLQSVWMAARLTGLLEYRIAFRIGFKSAEEHLIETKKKSMSVISAHEFAQSQLDV